MSSFSDERVRTILQGRAAIREYELPFAPEVKIALRVLSEKEIDDCRLQAQRYSRERKADIEIDPDFVEREMRRQMLWRACLDAADHSRPFFPSDSDVRTLDSELVRALFDVYYEHQTWVSPLRQLDDAQVKELADALGKARGARPSLASCDADTLRTLCISLACRVPST